MRIPGGIWILVACFLFSAGAGAYVPPSQFIVKSVAAKKAGYKGFRVRSFVSAMEGARAGNVHFKEVMIYDAHSRLLRSRAYDEGGRLLYSAERRLSDPHSRQASVKTGQLLFFGDAEILSASMKDGGVPVRVEAELAPMKDEQERRDAETGTVERWNGTVCWVAGPQLERKPREPGQLWVEKDSFLPVRAVLSTDDGMIDVRFEGYRFHREFPFPRHISLAMPAVDKVEKTAEGFSKNIVVRAETSEVVVNPAMSEFRQPFSPGFTDAGNSADSAVRDLIRVYYKFLR